MRAKMFFINFIKNGKMMKKTLALLIAVFFLFLQPGRVGAAQTSFMLTAIVPAALDSSVSAVAIDSVNNTDAPTIELNFGILIYNATNQIWTPAPADSSFALTVTGTGGAGMPTVDLAYTDTQTPVGQPHGLGWKSNMNFRRVMGTTELPVPNHAIQTMNNVNGEHITPAEVGAGYYLKMYVGLATGASGVPGEPFINSDVPGAYKGTLKVTATLQ